MGLLVGTRRSLLDGLALPAYYVDATSGNDGNDGKTPDLAWQTIGKINGETFLPGESILFKRGETWRAEAALPSSGIAGKPIVFGAYGSGTAPVISGADVIAGWTELPGSIDAGGAGAPRDDNLNVNVTYIDFTNPANGTGIIDHIELYINSIEAAADVKVGVFYSAGGDDYICRNVVTLSCTGAAGAMLTFDAPGDFAAFAVTAGDYVGVYGNTEVDLLRGNAGGSGTDNFAGDATDGGQYTFSGASNNRHLALYMTGSGPADVWQAAVTTEPNHVFFDGTKGALQASAVACNGANEWFWAANVLYVYSAGGDPDTEYTSPGIEAGARIRCIDLSDQDYIVIRDLHVTKANGQYFGNIDEHDNNGVARAGVVLRDIETDYAFSHGVRVHIENAAGSMDGLDIVSCHAHHNGQDGLGHGINVSGANAGSHTNVRIRLNTTNDNEQEGISTGWGSSAVYQNVSTDDGLQAGGGANIIIRLFAVNVAVYENYLEAAGGEGIWVDGRNTTGLQLYNNIILDAVDAGITLAQSADGTEIYHNTIWDVDNGIRLGSTAQVTNIILKNNLFDGGLSAANVQVLNGSTLTSDNNCFDENAAWDFDIGGVNTSWANWQVAGYDANGLFEDALMVNPGADDFHLQAGSPCRGAGAIDTGVTHDYDGVARPDPPTQPDIGAYEYVP